MDILQLAEIVIGSIISLGILIAGAGYGYGQFYRGRDDKTKEDYDLLNTRIDVLQKLCDKQQNELDGHQEQIRKLLQEIGRLQGINQEKDKKIDELTQLLQNRDPQLSEFIKFQRESTVSFQEIARQMRQDISQILSALGGRREEDKK